MYIHEMILKEENYHSVNTYVAAQLFSTCFLSSKSAYYYDFWRSCDTEDWSNYAENSAAHHRNILHFKTYSHNKQLF